MVRTVQSESELRGQGKVLDFSHKNEINFTNWIKFIWNKSTIEKIAFTREYDCPKKFVYDEGSELGRIGLLPWNVKILIITLSL